MKVSELTWDECKGKTFPAVACPGSPSIHRLYAFAIWKTDFIVTNGDCECEVTDTAVVMLDQAYLTKCAADTLKVTRK